jgi:hypothetical protein
MLYVRPDIVGVSCRKIAIDFAVWPARKYTAVSLSDGSGSLVELAGSE